MSTSDPGDPYAAPYGYQAYTPPQTEGMAVGALIASILAWMFCPVIAAIVALALVPGARRKIESSGGRLTGLGLLTATKWVAWLNIGFAVGVTILFIVLVIIGAVVGDTGPSSNFSFATFPR